MVDSKTFNKVVNALEVAKWIIDRRLQHPIVGYNKIVEALQQVEVELQQPETVFEVQ